MKRIGLVVIDLLAPFFLLLPSVFVAASGHLPLPGSVARKSDAPPSMGAAITEQPRGTGLVGGRRSLDAFAAQSPGMLVAGAGDVNGDGFADVLVGLPARGGTEQSGQAMLFLGSRSGLQRDPAWTVTSRLASFGASVAGAGDVNGDGLADILVSAPAGDADDSAGRVFLWYGSSSGPRGATIDTANWSATGVQPDEQFGWAIGRAGDVNGDGLADVVIGAPGFDGAAADEGRAVVYLGSARGPGAQPAWTMQIDQGGARFGCAVTGGADLDADGFVDLAIGAAGFDGILQDEGATWVFGGSPSGLAKDPSWRLVGDQAGAAFGSSLATGDLNADSAADLVVGAPGFEGEGLQSAGGAVFVFHGATDPSIRLPPQRSPDWKLVGSSEGSRLGASVAAVRAAGLGRIDALLAGAPMQATDGESRGRISLHQEEIAGSASPAPWMLDGATRGDGLGWTVATAGDVNGDGQDDIVAAQIALVDDEPARGRLRLFYAAGDGTCDATPPASANAVESMSAGGLAGPGPLIGMPPPAPTLTPGTISVTPASSVSVSNCYPFGNTTNAGRKFTGFIYKNVPAFTMVPGDKIRFDLGALNDVPIQRNIYFSRTVSPPSDCTIGGVTAVGWTRVVSESQTPLNPFGNTIIGDYELTYTAELGFGFPGGGLLIAFGATPPGTYVDNGCDQVLVTTACTDASGFFVGRFWNQPDQSLGPYTLNADTGALGGFKLESGGSVPPVCSAGPDVSVACDAVGITGSGSDPDGGTVTFAWTSSCSGTTFSPSASVASPTVTLGSNCRTCTLTLTVTDDESTTCSDTMVLAINDTTPPVLTGVPSATTVECSAIPAAPPVTATDNCVPAPAATLREVARVPATGLVGLWHLDEGSGSTAFDSFGTSNGTLAGAPLWVPGRSGSSLQFDGSNFVNIPNGAGGALDTRFSNTMIAYIFPTGVAGPIVNYQSTAAGGFGIHLWQTAPNQLFARFVRRDGSFTQFLAADVLVQNQWNCVGASYDNATGIARLWAGGVAVVTLNIGVTDLATQWPVRLALEDLDPRHYVGRIDEVAIYNRSLSAAEMQQFCTACPSNSILTRTWTATDACGNTASQAQVLTVRDTTPPVVSAGSISACYPSVAAAQAAALAATTATDNCSTFTKSVSTTGTCAATVTVTVTDECGNSASVMYATRIDNTPPTVTAGTIAACYPDVASAQAAAIAATTATDACPGTVTKTASTVGTCSATVTVTGADSCGNSAFVTYATRIDNTPPTVTAGTIAACYPDVASAQAAAIAATTATDACPGTPTKTASTVGTCSATVTVTGTDTCGNSAFVTYATRIDNTPPTVTAGTIAACYPDVASAQAAAIAATTATDTCPGTVTKTASTVGTCSATVTVTGTDMCGNSAFVTYATRIDNTPPTVTAGTIAACYPDVASAQAAAIAATTATDACPGTVTKTASTVGTCSATVTVTGTDTCGNSAFVTYATRIDNTPPTVTAGTIAACYPDVASAQAAAIAATTATDACPGTPTKTASTVGTCSATVTVTGTDTCGNSAFVTYATRIDNTPPTVTAGTIAACYPDVASAQAAAIAATTATDACPGTVTKTASTVGTCSATVTVTGTDSCGNSAFVTYATRIDNTPPTVTAGTITACYPDVASAQAAAIAATTATDACPGTVTKTASTVGTCSATVTVTGTDSCGNSAFVTYATRIDNTPPTVTAGTIAACYPDVASAQAAAIAATTATDTCPGTPTKTASTVGTCSATVTVTGTDSCGNSAFVTYPTRIDNTPPTVTAGTIAACYPTVASAESAAISATTATDACPGTVTKTASTVGTCSATVTVTGTDSCGNSAFVTYATRIDNTPPTLTPPAPLVVECNSPGGVSSFDGVIAAWLASVTASDSCGSATVPTNNVPAFLPSGCAPGATTTITFRSHDDCGNEGTATSTITVKDTTPPSIIVPVPLTLDCSAPGGIPSSDPAVVAWLASATASDICGTATTPVNDAPALIHAGCATGAITTVTFTSHDGCGNVGTATSTIVARDIMPPVVQADSGGTYCLWPPNHRMVCFSQADFHPVITDNCGAPTTWRFTGCASNEPDDGSGDGDTANDCQVAADGQSFCVRAERSGSGNGRAYSITITATDACGNAGGSVQIGVVSVPHDRPRRGC